MESYHDCLGNQVSNQNEILGEAFHQGLRDLQSAEVCCFPPVVASKKWGSSWNFFILIVKQDALDNRLKFSSDYDRALKNTRSKRENYEKLKSNPQSKPEKVSKAQSDVAEAEKEESDAKDLFFNTTESLKSEFDRADQERLQDFKSRLSETVQNQIYYEKKILQMFQELLPELENIVVV